MKKSRSWEKRLVCRSSGAWIAAGIGFLALISETRARPEGAGAGFSGGPNSPVSIGESCVACHSLGTGAGSVELVGTPDRYRPGGAYDLIVRIRDSVQSGAGFELSVETASAHTGFLQITDDTRTRFAEDHPSYATHRLEGYTESLADWAANGGSYDYLMRWTAPLMDEGPATFFLAALATDGAVSLDGDHFYIHQQTIPSAIAGDGDGDRDVDLFDFQMFLTCAQTSGTPVSEDCLHFDFTGDGVVARADLADFHLATSGPEAIHPAGFELADWIRGGLLYDNWMRLVGVTPPGSNHPLYPVSGQQSGAVTYRCKECHGWDYAGVAGAYGSGSHFTGIRGVLGSALDDRHIFNLLKMNPAEQPNGHDLDAYGLSDRDLWDLVRFVREGAVDTDPYIHRSSKSFQGITIFGQINYQLACFNCHGEDGTDLNFGTILDPEFVGTIAVGNPWEFLHKSRFGDPGEPMPSLERLGFTLQDVADLGVYAQSLPIE